MNSRVLYLDGLRGLAILLVVGFHAYCGYPDIVPYGSEYSEFPVFKYGRLGVQLFFFISGYVILMTLERCKNVGDFIFRRWLRLFPAMLISSIIIFASATFFFERPSGQPTLSSLLPGLLFIEPSWLNNLFEQKITPLEGSFWSLYVEFKFYLIAALIYFFAKKENFTIYIFGLFLMALVFKVLNKAVPIPLFEVGHTIIYSLSLQYFGYFAAGAEFYKFAKTGILNNFYFGTVIALLSPLGFTAVPDRILAAAFVSVLFASIAYSQKLQQILNNRFLVFLGFISYPLYLLHENMMISLIVKVNGTFDQIPGFLLPLIAIGLIAVIAFLISARLERSAKRLLEGLLRRSKVVQLPQQ